MRKETSREFIPVAAVPAEVAAMTKLFVPFYPGNLGYNGLANIAWKLPVMAISQMNLEMMDLSSGRT
jgi:hypothetical protein